MSGIITLRPTPAPTHLPICNGRATERPHLEAVLAWCFVEVELQRETEANFYRAQARDERSMKAGAK